MDIRAAIASLALQTIEAERELREGLERADEATAAELFRRGLTEASVVSAGLARGGFLEAALGARYRIAEQTIELEVEFAVRRSLEFALDVRVPTRGETIFDARTESEERRRDQLTVHVQTYPLSPNRGRGDSHVET